MYKEQK